MVFFNQKHSTFASIHAELKTTQLGMPKPAPLSYPRGLEDIPSDRIPVARGRSTSLPSVNLNKKWRGRGGGWRREVPPSSHWLIASG